MQNDVCFLTKIRHFFNLFRFFKLYTPPQEEAELLYCIPLSFESSQPIKFHRLEYDAFLPALSLVMIPMLNESRNLAPPQMKKQSFDKIHWVHPHCTTIYINTHNVSNFEDRVAFVEHPSAYLNKDKIDLMESRFMEQLYSLVDVQTRYYWTLKNDCVSGFDSSETFDCFILFDSNQLLWSTDPAKKRKRATPTEPQLAMSRLLMGISFRDDGLLSNSKFKWVINNWEFWPGLVHGDMLYAITHYINMKNGPVLRRFYRMLHRTKKRRHIVVLQFVLHQAVGPRFSPKARQCFFRAFESLKITTLQKLQRWFYDGDQVPRQTGHVNSAVNS